MSRRSSSVIALVFLAGCSQATLPYKPEAQPKGAKVAAAYQMLADRLKIEIDTDHRRLEDLFIVRADGTAVRAQTIENAPVVTGPGPTVGIGIGGASIGRGGGVAGRPIRMQVTAAHAGRLHLEDDLAGTGRGIGKLLDLELTIAEEHDAAHGGPPWRLDLITVRL